MTALVNFMNWALEASPDHPILIDKFLEDAIEVDVDAICDGKHHRHRRHHGAHRRGGHPFRRLGLRAAALFTLPARSRKKSRAQTRALAAELGVIGLLNIQFAVKGRPDLRPRGQPPGLPHRALRSKATGVSLAKLATKVMLGHSLDELGFTKEIEPPYFAVKESVFPFRRFPGVDPLLGPEMRSTGEVMGIDEDFGLAFAKSQLAAGQVLPLCRRGASSASRTPDKPQAAHPGQGLSGQGLPALCHQRHRGLS